MIAARAAGGTGPGVNAPLTTQFWDTTGSGNHGTLTSFAGTAASGYAGAGTIADPYRLVFDGSSDYVACPSLGAADDGIFTYESWFNLASIPASPAALVAEMVAGGAKWACLWVATATGVVTFRNVRDSSVLMYGNTASLCDGAWHHATATCDGTNMCVYIDGVLKGGPTAMPAGVITCAYTTVGCRQYGASSRDYWQTGAMSVARIYPFALTAAQVVQNYSAGVA